VAAHQENAAKRPFDSADGVVIPELPFIQRSPDFFQHAFWIFIESFVLEPDYLNSSLLQISGPPVIVIPRCRSEMPRPIQFHHDAFFRTKEVDNVRTNATLPTEFNAIELAVFQVAPENSLCNRRRIAEFFAVFLFARDIVNPAFVFTHDMR